MADRPDMPMASKQALARAKRAPKEPVYFWIVVEDTIIWAAFSTEEHAAAFASREFSREDPVHVVEVRVYDSVAEAPTTDGEDLQEAAAW
jgi:hypothetical protein